MFGYPPTKSHWQKDKSCQLKGHFVAPLFSAVLARP
jgi:hypothetical protein